MVEEGEWWNHEIAGIGPAAKERIENQFNAFAMEVAARAEANEGQAASASSTEN
jgi:hypothetical protein